MSKEKPGLVKTPLDELTYRVNGLAMQVHRELKAGHKESFYQRRLAELCQQAGLQVEIEKRVEVWVDDMMIGYLYLDLWVEDSLVVECKAVSHDLTDDELSQILVYLAATSAPVGMLYNFGSFSLEFHRILRPKLVQDWQKYLCRCVWRPPGTPSLSLLSETSRPIRFSVVSSLANQPPIIQSEPESTAKSVPLRESATESVNPSVLIRESVTESAKKNPFSSANPRQSPLKKSVPLRDSVTKSVDESVPLRESVTKSVNKSVSDYAASGVDIDSGNRTVELMKAAVKSTYGAEVLTGIGAFGGQFDASAIKQMKSPVLVSSTDGVGTKVKLAAQAGRYRSVGQDIVNHCIDDILVQGARPLFFLDYFATSRLVPEITAEIVAGMADACREAGMALIGGETAEMPGVYASGEFDIAGTIVGVVERSEILPRLVVRAGDMLVGIRSSGPHTNGYSLIRKIFEDVPLETVFPKLGISLADALLAPHRSYYPVLYPLLPDIKALAHLTGGGFIENIPRVLPEDVNVEIWLGSWPVPPLFDLVQQRGEVAREEMYRVFNMGIGMVAIVDKENVAQLQKSIPEQTWIIGELVPGDRQVILK